MIALCFAGLFGGLLLPPPPDYPFYTIRTVAGTGVGGFSGDGGPAGGAQIYRPTSIAVDEAGNLFICDDYNNRIRRIGVDGTITTVAGNGTRGFSGDGGPAAAAALNHPYGIHLGANGVLYIADQQNNRVRRVVADGTISTVAGSGSAGFSGDGGLATRARLTGPDDMAEDRDGNLFIADTGNDRIRRVDRHGVITTFCGRGQNRFNHRGGYTGDGGPAVDANITEPATLAIAPDGGLIYADFGNDVYRKIGRDGIIRTVLGASGYGFNGDGWPALRTHVSELGSLAFSPDGTMFFCDGANYRVRCVTRDGRVHTVAGLGTRSFSGDGGPADDAGIGVFDSIALAKDGSIYLADFSNNRIRKLTPIANPDVEHDPKMLLMRMRRAYANIGHVSIEHRLTKVRRDPGVVRGRVEFTEPSTLHARYATVHGEWRLDCDGKEIVTTDSLAEKSPQIDFTLHNLESELGMNLELLCLFEAGTQLSTAPGGGMETSELSVRSDVEWNGRRWLVLHEVAGAIHADYYVDPATFLIWRVHTADASGIPQYEGSITSLRISRN